MRLASVEEIDRYLNAGTGAADRPTRAEVVDFVCDMHDQGDEASAIAELAATVMLPGVDVDRKALASWCRRALHANVRTDVVLAHADGTPLLEVESRPSWLSPGERVARWKVAPGAEARIRGLQLRQTRNPERYVIIHRATTTRGMPTISVERAPWQATWFDELGAGGDIREPTLERALNDGARAHDYAIELADVIGGADNRDMPPVAQNPQDIGSAIDAAVLEDLRRLVAHLSDYDNVFSFTDFLRNGGAEEQFAWLKRQKYIAARPPRAFWGMTDAGWDWLGPYGVGRPYAKAGRRNPDGGRVTVFHAADGRFEKVDTIRFGGGDYGPGLYTATDPGDTRGHGIVIYRAELAPVRPLVVGSAEAAALAQRLARAVGAAEFMEESNGDPWVQFVAFFATLVDVGGSSWTKLGQILVRQGFDCIHVPNAVIRAERSSWKGDAAGDFYVVLSAAIVTTWTRASEPERARARPGVRANPGRRGDYDTEAPMGKIIVDRSGLRAQIEGARDNPGGYRSPALARIYDLLSDADTWAAGALAPRGLYGLIARDVLESGPGGDIDRAFWLGELYTTIKLMAERDPGITRAERAQLQREIDARIERHDRGGKVRNPAGDAHARKAAAMFSRFHTRDWRAEGAFHPSMIIPAELCCLGDALNTDYQSDKLHPASGEDEGWIDYTHKHDAGVRIYAPVTSRRPGNDDCVRTPAWIKGVVELTWLGKYLGGEYRARAGRQQIVGTEPLPELYTAPSGKALFIVQNKRSLLFVLWGGRLTVERRGIVH